MKKIFKYKLEDTYVQIIDIPLPAAILSVEEQRNNIVLYSIVDPDEDVPKVSINVLVIETGESIKENLDMYKFLGTVKLHEGKRVLHVFYRYIGPMADDGYKTSEVSLENIKDTFINKNRDMVIA